MIRAVLVLTAIVSASAFTAAPVPSRSSALKATGYEEVGGQFWDPLELSKLGKNIDTFPNMFPDKQFLQEAEIKHGRMAMLAWTGAWATCNTGMGLGMHFPGYPVEPDFTKAFAAFSSAEPATTAAILLFISIAEGESVGWTGDNWRGKSTKEPGDLGLDYLGLKNKLSQEKLDRYKIVEMKNGRAAMIAMASLFAWKSIPGSVPLMDIFTGQV